jgi:hypothetical protein
MKLDFAQKRRHEQRSMEQNETVSVDDTEAQISVMKAMTEEPEVAGERSGTMPLNFAAVVAL